MSGARAGEQDLAVVAPTRWRRWALASAIVVVLLAVVVGGALTSQFFSAFPRGACKGIGYSSAIDGAPLDGGGVPGFASPEAALAAFAPGAPSLGPDRAVPADGWEEYRGRWVRDMHDGSYYEMDVYESPNGWVTGGDFVTCGF